ncbi:MAG: hypothetical protein F4Y49_03010 [Dehalococcoidia bacterium]|nr:hypothetical protein [Dehalococcoidia bacterium]
MKNQHVKEVKATGLRFGLWLWERERKAAVARWRQGWREGVERNGCWLTTVAVVFNVSVPFILLGWAFDQGIAFGTQFVLAVAFAVLRGNIFRHPLMTTLVGVGLVIGVYVLTDLRDTILGLVWQGQILNAAILGAVAFRIRQLKREFDKGLPQAGKMDDSPPKTAGCRFPGI